MVFKHAAHLRELLRPLRDPFLELFLLVLVFLCLRDPLRLLADLREPFRELFLVDLRLVVFLFLEVLFSLEANLPACLDVKPLDFINEFFLARHALIPEGVLPLFFLSADFCAGDRLRDRAISDKYKLC